MMGLKGSITVIVLAEPVFGHIEPFSEGLAAVKADGARNKYGYIDRTGKLAVPFLYDEALRFSEGLSAVRNEREWGFIERSGDIALPFEYSEARSFSEGLAYVRYRDIRKGERRGYIDKNGRMLFSPVWKMRYETLQDFHEGYAIVERRGEVKDGFYTDLCGFINKTWNEIIPLNFEEVCCFSDGFAAVKKDSRWGFIDRTGNVIVPFAYDDCAACFSEGLAAVLNDDGWGFVDQSGKLVIPNRYDDLNRRFHQLNKEHKMTII
jgi:hypothetical protein